MSTAPTAAMTTSPGAAPARIGIVTISDRASAGVYQDLGGPAIRDTLNDFLSSPWEECYRVIPDEQPLIEATLKEIGAEARTRSLRPDRRRK